MLWPSAVSARAAQLHRAAGLLDAELNDVVDLEASRHGTKLYLSPGFLWRCLSNAEVMSRPQKSKDIRTACDRIGGPWAMEFPGPLLRLRSARLPRVSRRQGSGQGPGHLQGSLTEQQHELSLALLSHTVLKAAAGLPPEALQLGGDLRTVIQSRKSLFALGQNLSCGGWAGQVPPGADACSPRGPVCRAWAETSTVSTLCSR